MLTTSKNTHNIIETLGFLTQLIKNTTSSGLKLPNTNLTDEVNMKEENEDFNNTVFGESLLVNLCTILNHFDIEKDYVGLKNIDGTYGESFRPLGFKRYYYN